MKLLIEDVSDIFDIFNLEEVGELIQNQIADPFSTKTDYFKPLYVKYKRIINTEGNTEDVKLTADKRFMNICSMFINLISKKFGITLDADWKEDNHTQIPALTMALYSFFVLELPMNITTACQTFMEEHGDEVYHAFEDRKLKKDAITLVSKKELTTETAVIMSNIYDVVTWILSQLSESEFTKLLPQDYVPLVILNQLFTQGNITGEFMVAINDLYATNIPLKGEICFQLITIIKRGQLTIEV